MTVEPPVTRSRRALLLGALGGLAGLLGGRFTNPEPAAGAAGSNLIIGSEANNAGTADTQLITNSTVIAFKLLQNGPGTGLMGYATAASGATRGVYGRSDSPNGDGVQGRSAGANGSGAAVRAIGGNNTGVIATGAGFGVHGSSAGTGVFGSGNTGVSAVGQQYGVYGSATGTGVVGSGTTYGGYFFGNTHVQGTLSKSAGAFRIDHPLDPENLYLQHSFVESPEMKNVYDGVVTLDGHGEATVDLPAWFDALNGDTRIQLTPIGEHSPLFARAEVSDGRFAIAGGRPGQKVFWQVTGIRRDAYAASHRIQVEVPKASNDRGRYLHPELFGGHEADRIGPRNDSAAG